MSEVPSFGSKTISLAEDSNEVIASLALPALASALDTLWGCIPAELDLLLFTEVSEHEPCCMFHETDKPNEYLVHVTSPAIVKPSQMQKHLKDLFSVIFTEAAVLKLILEGSLVYEEDKELWKGEDVTEIAPEKLPYMRDLILPQLAMGIHDSFDRVEEATKAVIEKGEA